MKRPTRSRRRVAAKKRRSTRVKRSKRSRRTQRGGDMPSGYVFPVTATMPSGQLGDPDAIPTVMSSDKYAELSAGSPEASALS